MKLLRFFQFAYLIFAALFIYDGIVNLGKGDNQSIISFLLAGLAIFMYFFRKRFRKRFEERRKNRQSNQ